MEGPDLELRGITKEFPATSQEQQALVAVHDVSLTVGPRQFFSLLGPSGCGKTTTLRMIAGFEEPTRGEIRIRGEDVAGVPPFKRNVNTTFQSYALFPHLDVFENVAFGLRRKGLKGKPLEERVDWALALVRLEGFEKRRPALLSGGEEQRVSMARALVNTPAVLLLDEPLSALDEKLRKHMQLELKRIQRETGISFILVTHDQEEALTLSDTIAVMNQGRVEQVGTPRELYESPATRFVAEFIGASNFFAGTIVERRGDLAMMDLGIALPWTPSLPIGEPLEVAVRPEKMRLSLQRPDEGNALPARVVDIAYQGAVTRYQLALDSGQTVLVTRQNTGSDEGVCAAGESVFVLWNPVNTRVVAASKEPV